MKNSNSKAFSTNRKPSGSDTYINNNNNDTNIYYLNQISEKYNLKINCINLFDVKNLNQHMEKFISGCLIRKKNNLNKPKKTSIKTLKPGKENNTLIQFTRSEGSAELRDSNSSSRKAKKDNCSVF